MSAPETDRRLPTDRFVEFVRPILVVFFAAGGYTVATRLSNPTTQRTPLGVVLGSGIGFVIGNAVPVVARNVIQTATCRMVFASLQGGA